MRLKLTAALLLSVVLVGAAACGGGSDGLSQAEEEALQAELAAAEEAQRKAEEARREAELEQARAEARAEEARRQRQAAEQQRQAEEEARQAEEEARQAAEAAAEEAQRRLTEAEQAELRARASSFGTVLDLGDGGTAEQGPVTVSWPRGSSLTFRPQGTLTPGSTAPSVPGGWRSAGFTGQTGTAAALTDETAYLYTNIQAPSNRAFWKRYGLSIADISTITGHASLAKGGSATAKTVTQTDTSDPPVRTTDVTELTVSGSFDGAGGSFTCATACGATNVGGGDLATSAEINTHIAAHVTFSQGQPIFATPGNWTFKPGNIASGVPLDQDDAYLYFGIWSSIPDSISGTTYNFRYVAGGGAASGGGLANFDDLTGSATFRGGAVGKYVTQGQVGGQNAKIGTFTATATLNADFGADNAGTLSGSITDFQEGGSPLTGWRVTLGSAGNVGVAAPIASAAVATQDGGTVANIGGLPVGGSWGATFHGSDNQVLADRTKYPATRYPPVDLAGVTGWFDAVGTSASLAGAFAATPSN